MNEKNEKRICFALAIIMFFVGMCLEITEIDSSFLYANTMVAHPEVIEVEDYVMDETAGCTLNMISNNTVSICRSLNNSMTRLQGAGVLMLFCFVGMALQYLFIYQSAECKEDAQLLLCRFVAVRYIHQQDGEK